MARAFLSFLDVSTRNEASRYAPESVLCFQFVLFPLWLCRIWFVSLSLKITAVFFSFKKKGRDQDSQQGGLALQRVTCHSDIEEQKKKEKSGTSFSNLLNNTET